jgi:hypothetical protein
MFKKTIVGLALAIITFTGTSLAQEQPKLTKPFFMNILLPCDSKITMSRLIQNQFGEQPFTQSNGSMFPFTGNNKQQLNKLPGIVKVWANPSTWTFSVTIEDPSPNNDIMCMLTKGTSLKPMATKGDAL